MKQSARSWQLCFDSLAIRLRSKDLKHLIPIPVGPGLWGEHQSKLIFSDLHGERHHPSRVCQQPCRLALSKVRLQSGGTHSQLLRQIFAGKFKGMQTCSFPKTLSITLQCSKSGQWPPPATWLWETQELQYYTYSEWKLFPVLLCNFLLHL